ncbi:hypothetical protein SLEP1_g54285 [Rubroshorea leprosula]|uniref:Uncharacterized protein n=1 Tax=Rubroshorea leprosula TaxID=152421 RepID=A0AAV5MBX4_9ROSI|nr:hypothetical protein SLEP1_g54285 [Rubroshorea leprosula]
MRTSNLVRALPKCSLKIAPRLEMIEKSEVGARSSDSKVKESVASDNEGD